MSARCPRGTHPYPEARMTKMNYGKPRFYCGACRRERDNARFDRGGEPYEPDWEAVKRAVYGDPPERLHASERRLAAEELYCQGLCPGRKRVSITTAAQRLRCTPRHASRLFKQIKEGK